MHPTLKAYLLLTALSISISTSAEVVLDGTLGTSSGTLPGPDFAINADMGKRLGNNLFHSFETFNLKHNESATFSGPTMIKNIISRVTGGNASYIDGLLRSEIPNADMYFLNPAGIMFGKNARLDVKGSFHASTADYLRLGKDGRFDATYPEHSLLKVAPPSAFGFLDDSPAPISKQGGFLWVPPKETFSFIGGNLKLQDAQFPIKNKMYNSFIRAVDGQINLVSIASSGEVPINPKNMPDNAFEKFGKITITDTTEIQNKDIIGNVDVSGSGGGEIYIRGGQIYMENAYVWADTHGDENGQNITIKATDELVAIGARITTEVMKNATGNGGNINVAARRITLTDGTQIASNTRSSGNAGNITIIAEEAIKIFGAVPFYGRSGLLSNTTGIGDGGDGGQIFIKTPTLTLADSSTISTQTLNRGNAGDILLDVNTLTLKEGAQIDLNASDKRTTTNTGHGGKLTITAKESVLITGQSERTSALISNTKTNGAGGEINISTPQLEVQNNGTIQAGTGGIGQGGNISLNVDNLNIRQEGSITAESIGKGNAGSISITTNAATLTQGSRIATSAIRAGGGNIKLQVHKYLYLFDNSEITAHAGGNKTQDKGGNITINYPQFVVFDKSQLRANAFGGNGGNINVGADNFISSSESVINASSELGIDGKVQINARDMDFIDIQLHLPSRPLPKLLLNRCAGFTKENLSRFLITIRDVLPPTPEDLRM
jgi:filamentous hemagglutinin family protein